MRRTGHQPCQPSTSSQAVEGRDGDKERVARSRRPGKKAKVEEKVPVYEADKEAGGIESDESGTWSLWMRKMEDK